MNMRRLRKLTVAVLTVALVLTSMTTVFAADPSPTVENADKAATLKDLGLYSGQDVNDPTVGLQDALTTQDSLIFLSKLFGYNDAANALTADQVAEALAKFDDAASISDYAKNVVAYSATNGILSGSTKDDKFFVGAEDTVTAERFATFMLRQMDYTVADYRQSVAKLAETKGSKVDATLTGDLTRDDAVGVMYGALTAEKASGKTVIEDIIGDNADLKAKAEKLGLIVDSVTESSRSSEFAESSLSSEFKLKVESVKALNLKQIEIKFNAEMDRNSVQDKANYKIKDKGTDEKTLTNTSCKLGDDKMTVTITLDHTVKDCLTNDTKATVIVSKEIQSAYGHKLGADKEVIVEVKDDILPTVKEVKATGKKNIRITFSEPVYGGNNDPLNVNNFKVVGGNDGKDTYDVQKVELNLDVVNLELNSELIDGPITVIVNNAGLVEDYAIRDYAGHKVFKSDHTFNYVINTSVAVVTVKSARGNKVVLKFSKPVKGKNIKLYHTVKNAEAYKAEATTEGYVDEITFTFDKFFPKGEVKLYLVNSKVEGEKIIDRFGIKVPDQAMYGEVEMDDIAPVVMSCEIDRDESIKIKFDEELDKKVAIKPDSYEVKRVSDGKEIPFTAVLDDRDSMNSVELKFNPKLEDYTEYQLSIKHYQDIYGNANTSAYEYTFTTGDNKAPEVNDKEESDERCYAEVEKGMIFIIYSEAMNEEQMLNPEYYRVSIDGGANYNALGKDDTITKVNDRKVQIYVKDLEGKKDSNINVKIAPIMDLANKRLYGGILPYIVKIIDSDNVYIEEAQLIAKNKIKVVFNKEMEQFNRSDIVLTHLTTPGAINIVGNGDLMTHDGKSEVELILDKELATDVTDGGGARIGITTSDTPKSVSVSGSKLKANYDKVPLDDKVAPEIVWWDHDNDQSTDDIAKILVDVDIVEQVWRCSITIFFSEDISKDSKESPLTVDTFSVDGFTITGISAPMGTKTVVLAVVPDNDNISGEPTVTQNSPIEDVAGNVLAEDLK